MTDNYMTHKGTIKTLYQLYQEAKSDFDDQYRGELSSLLTATNPIIAKQQENYSHYTERINAADNKQAEITNLYNKLTLKSINKKEIEELATLLAEAQYTYTHVSHRIAGDLIEMLKPHWGKLGETGPYY